jgi:hypothetical protein
MEYFMEYFMDVYPPHKWADGASPHMGALNENIATA